MAAETQSKLRKRTVHQLDTPYSTVPWPEVSPQDQDTISELLCDLLSPLGQHRRTHLKPSKGRKATKREREARTMGSVDSPLRSAPPPGIINSVDIGLNSITRNLVYNHSSSPTDDRQNQRKPYSMIFVSRGDQSSAFNCHFPKMVAAASKDLRSTDRIRLVGFSKPCSERLSDCLGIARVSSIAIMHDAPGAGALWDVVKTSVEPIDIGWLDGGHEASYLATQINAIETTVGPKRAKQ